MSIGSTRTICQSERMKNAPLSSIRNIIAYSDKLEQEGRSIIHLELGEPDFGTPAHIIDACKKALDNQEVHYGPIAGTVELRKALSRHCTRYGLEYAPEEILVSTGVVHGVFLSMLAYLDPGDEILVPDPGYLIYFADPHIAQAKPVSYPLREENGFQLDAETLEALITPRTKAILFNTPNNPTGRLVDGALLRAAAEQCRAVGAVLAVDECFLPLSDGAGPGLAPCLAEHPNLLLLRAFTKSYAMAGLRLGYALSANGGLLERMAAAGPPWSVSTPAQAAGLAALEQCSDWPEKARALLASERPALSDGLAALGLEVVPGQANYLLFRAAGAADLNDRILTRGVLIRSCANYHGLGNDWYRVCVGQAEQNRRLLAALKEVL